MYKACTKSKLIVGQGVVCLPGSDSTIHGPIGPGELCPWGQDSEWDIARRRCVNYNEGFKNTDSFENGRMKALNAIEQL